MKNHECTRCRKEIATRHPRAYKRTVADTFYHWPYWNKEKFDNHTGGLTADRPRVGR